MRPYLLDINVLIALAWPNHVHHRETLRWFRANSAAGFRTCPITQTGFVRISSNPAFTKHAVTPSDAVALLVRLTELPTHDFWADDLAIADVVADGPVIAGHGQVTDLYLLRLAVHRGGVLATLDRGLETFARRAGAALEVITVS